MSLGSVTGTGEGVGRGVSGVTGDGVGLGVSSGAIGSGLAEGIGLGVTEGGVDASEGLGGRAM